MKNNQKYTIVNLKCSFSEHLCVKRFKTVSLTSQRLSEYSTGNVHCVCVFSLKNNRNGFVPGRGPFPRPLAASGERITQL